MPGRWLALKTNCQDERAHQVPVGMGMALSSQEGLKPRYDREVQSQQPLHLQPLLYAEAVLALTAAHRVCATALIISVGSNEEYCHTAILMAELELQSW